MTAFWEGDKATHPDAPQRLLLLALRAIEDRDPNWVLIDACLNQHSLDEDKAKDALRKAITALAAKAAKAVASAAGADPRAVGPAEHSMLVDGWEPGPVLTARLINQWGAMVERTGWEPRDGAMVCRLVWHAHQDPHAEPSTEGWRTRQRCFLEQHPQNPAWWRIAWASWREGAEAWELPTFEAKAEGEP